jgi:hypothetical protein
VANPNSSRLSYFVGTKGRPFSLDETIQGLSSEVSKLDMSSDFETELTQTLRSISNALRSFDGKVLLPEQRNKIFRTIENEIERYCVRYYFSPVIMTRARYDIVRDRLSDLGLVNVILRKGSWITEEEIYSVAVPSHSYHDGVFPTHDTKELGEVFRVRVHWPSYENQKEEFVKSLIDAAKLADTGIGFADIPTVREIVSERLMIPSSLFDSFLRKASNEADIKIDFALASERVTSSRLPILLSASKAYNLIRVRT